MFQISKYAVHNPSVGFTLKKQGENLADIRTNPNSSHIDNIRSIYGNNIARYVDFRLIVSGVGWLLGR